MGDTVNTIFFTLSCKDTFRCIGLPSETALLFYALFVDSYLIPSKKSVWCHRPVQISVDSIDFSQF
jgi:hypothetical protein